MVIFRESKSWQGHLGGFWGAGHVEYLDWGWRSPGEGRRLKACAASTYNLLTFRRVLCP